MAPSWSFLLLLAVCLLTTWAKHKPAANGILTRKNVDSLSSDEIIALQRALREVNEDTSPKGYAAIAASHGYPGKCEYFGQKVACCIHGMAAFASWHRLYVVQMEQALKEKGLNIGIPYWDWTKPVTALPKLVDQPVFVDPNDGKARPNVWFSGDINIDGQVVHTDRAIDERLFQKVEPGEETFLFNQILDALEAESVCQFFVQYEVAHNSIHYLVGGPYEHSLATLEFSSYDPIFFIHHANLDRILSLYFQISIRRTAGKCEGGACEFCDFQPMVTPMAPFSWDSNPFEVTKSHSIPVSAQDNKVLGYDYDDMTLNGHDIDELVKMIEARKSYDRSYAAFRLNGIKSSANVRVNVCVPSSKENTEDHCEVAGDFFVLGGALEMPWWFNSPYYFDITKTVQKMGVALDSNYFVNADLFSVNGTKVPSSTIAAPYVAYFPAKGKRDPPITRSESSDVAENVVVRKDVDHLSREEIYQLREALNKFQADGSVDGFQATAEFHGEPGRCPFPTAKERFACCIHGQFNFPHWHRLFVVQFEDGLRRRGLKIGIPYFDWTKPETGQNLPALVADPTYVDPYTGETKHNPFHDAPVGILGNVHTSRELFPAPPPPAYGDHNALFDAMLYAFEQTDFCDFEVQVEIIHNAIHAAIGGTAEVSMAGLSYSAFDPVFYVHHSNVDRLWAIWTALQEYRGLPYKAHCGQSYVYEKLKPFAFHSPLNNNEKTYAHSVPTEVYDYEKELGYTYETLEFGGMTIPELDAYINKQKAKSRVFIGGLAWALGGSATVTAYINGGGVENYFAGMFAILGGPSEMPWRLDRQFRLDITDALNALGLKHTDPFTVVPVPRWMNGSVVAVTAPVPGLSIIYKQGIKTDDGPASDMITRKNVEELTVVEVNELRQAMAKLQADSSPGGFQDLGRYHGTPKWCEANGKKVACCLHGMAAFPNWHRLWTVQAENALRRNGFKGALPYWEWTTPQTHLPALVANATYKDPVSGNETPNPFFSGPIADAGATTVRSINNQLYAQPDFGSYTAIAQQVMYAFEQDNYCDFEVQFEISHNFIHALVGGTETYSMASLVYTAFDPIFYLHHSNTDRNWAVWQALQKYRGKAYNTANCAVAQMRQPMAPFSMGSGVNPDSETREHSRPYQTFDYEANFHYAYDNLEFNGLSIPQLARVLEENKEHDRIFAGFVLHGIQKSALVKFYICKTDDDCNHYAGEFYVLGAEAEMPWAYDRLYKYEITHQVEELGLKYNDRYHLRYEVIDLAGHVVSTDAFPAPSVVYEPGTKRIQGQDYQTDASHVRKNLESLNKGEIESLRAAFRSIKEDGTYEKIASYHGKPGLCRLNGGPIACCVHGMPTFPAWHRLYVEQVEEALLHRGSSVSVPYWDWTSPITKLPDLINKATYYDSRTEKFQPNPFFSGKIAGENANTTRDPQPELFNNDYFNEQVLFALEQDNFCDFEIQFELIHNTLHSWLGGRALYSVSSLDYSAFDPVFFLHHATTDRIWAIWQELQKYRGHPYNEADCAINLMHVPLQPFNNASININGVMTRKNSRPADTFDYRNNFHYEYDNLNYHGMNIAQLDHLLQKRQSRERVFAGFLLHNIGLSADVEIYVCVPTGPQKKQSCNAKAGVFSVLGGELEMPFTFDRLYKHEITDTVRELGLKLDSAVEFGIKVQIRAVNGSYLSPDILPKPTISFVPGSDDGVDHDGHRKTYMVRKEIHSLSPPEEYFLVKAMRAFQRDSSGDGYQSIASFHALPPLCPSPDAAKRWACCRHGMASFPQWHRLYTVQAEDALRRHGSFVGIPYWDWTRVSDSLPAFFNEPTVYDPITGAPEDNPWYKAHIDFENTETERDPLGEYIFQRGPKGWDSWLFNQALFALEQENYCDFEVQFEILHNAIHSWLGGSKEKGMGHLHYASYDPVFYIHHSSTDRLWAVWQALQEYRGHHSNEFNCAMEQMRDPLKPFSFGPPYNLNPTTFEYSRPEDTFDYKEHFNYRYDNLDFVGMSVDRLDAFIKEKQERDRVYAGFLLSGFGSSALVDFEICKDGNCVAAGYFTVLGGQAEMPWRFDRLYKYEITDVLLTNGIHFDDEYDFKIHVKYINGTELDSSIIPTPSVLVDKAHGDHSYMKVTPNHVRRNVDDISYRDATSLTSALWKVMEDEGPDRYENIASYKYQPGSPTFLQWNRLYLLQVEQALQRKGSVIAIPYWDWTLASGKIPKLLTDESYYDAWRDEVVKNPFMRAFITSEDTYTVRQTVPQFYMNQWNTTLRPLAYSIATAFEAENFCDFSIVMEICSNSLRGAFGGYSKYSLFSQKFGKFDPAYLLTQAFIDKLWVNWQEIQKRRGLEWKTADCAISYMHQPLEPFNDPNVNTNHFTRMHSTPADLFETEDLFYAYDNFNIGGLTLEQGMAVYSSLRSNAGVYLGFMIKGTGANQAHIATVCQGGNACTPVTGFTVIGGPDDKAWSYDRLYKADITIPLQLLGISPEDVFEPNPSFTIQMIHLDENGQPVIDANYAAPRIIYKPPKGAIETVDSKSVAGVGVRKEVSSLTDSEVKSLRHALQRVKDDHGPNGFHSIASMHGAPPSRCTYEGRPIACCLHGMPSFPMWHRLYVKQFEDALTAQGAKVGIPYWDWTAAFTALPTLVTAPGDNPFRSGTTPDGHETSRAPREQLFNDPEFGNESFFYRQALLMFEQTDYCDFEVQFEITHNAIHSWTGGRSPYGMSTLEYTAYDPLFMIHHSNADRQFAIWQALQKFRGLPYNYANCAIQKMKRPMRPFSDEDNVNPTTRANSHANDAFDYDRLDYQYDNLNFHGLTISELNDVVEKRREEDRIFAEFMLHGFGASADVNFTLCDDSMDHCEFAGTFAVLGGPIEMPWAFDRLFKYDVTKAFRKINMRPDGAYHFHVHVTAVNGTELDSSIIGKPIVQFVPGVKGQYHKAAAKHADRTSDQLVRKEVHQLTIAETKDIRNALYKLQQDSSPNGYEAIAGFHGYPYRCPESGDDKYACCIHGMPVFPHWHRLHTIQFEQALKSKGAHIGVPYWDWTVETGIFPALFGDTDVNNPFFHYTIAGNMQTTSRNVSSPFVSPKFGAHNRMFYLALQALEEDNYCDFEVQFEVLHNEVHGLIGGAAQYSMSTLDYSAFDPFFMIHHSATDRIWTIWQELQKHRRKPFNVAPCAGNVINQPLQPFNYGSINKNDFTRINSVPSLIFDSSRLGYTYDNLELNGHDVAEIDQIIHDLRSHSRYFIAMTLFGVKLSCYIEGSVIDSNGKEYPAFKIHVLGSGKEVPWAYERVYRADITKQYQAAGFTSDKSVDMKVDLVLYNGQTIQSQVMKAAIVEKPAHANYDILTVVFNSNNVMVPKMTVKKGTRVRFVTDDLTVPIENVGSYTVYSNCNIPPFSYKTYEYGKVYKLPPGDYFFTPKSVDICKSGQKMTFTVEED